VSHIAIEASASGFVNACAAIEVIVSACAAIEVIVSAPDPGPIACEVQIGVPAGGIERALGSIRADREVSARASITWNHEYRGGHFAR